MLVKLYSLLQNTLRYINFDIAFNLLRNNNRTDRNLTKHLFFLFLQSLRTASKPMFLLTTRYKRIILASWKKINKSLGVHGWPLSWLTGGGWGLAWALVSADYSALIRIVDSEWSSEWQCTQEDTLKLCIQIRLYLGMCHSTVYWRTESEAVC